MQQNYGSKRILRKYCTIVKVEQQVNSEVENHKQNISREGASILNYTIPVIVHVIQWASSKDALGRIAIAGIQFCLPMKDVKENPKVDSGIERINWATVDYLSNFLNM